MKKIIYLLLILMTVLLLTSTVFAAKQDFDQKEFKASWKYASKQIAKNKYVLNGMVDKATIEKNIKTFLKEKYQQKQKVAKWKIRTAIRNEVNELRKSEKATNPQTKILSFLSKYKNKFNFLGNLNQITGGVISVPDVLKDILGCTDIKANNYNSEATKADNSCTYDVLGCTDSEARNFNRRANVNDNSCVYDVLGCTDSEARNFNRRANVNDNSCVYDVLGCTDSTAENYNSFANLDDNSCKHSTGGGSGGGGSGSGSTPVNVLGCTDVNANNFNENANADDNSCTYDTLGCTEVGSLNFNSDANVNDGSCIAIVNGCTDANYLEYDENANFDDNSCSTLIVNGCTDANYLEYDENANVNDGSCLNLIVEGCTDQTAFNYNPNANVNDGGCIAVVEGCTDSNANNYNQNANTDDNSCTYNIFGCTDSNALNYDENANVDDNSCEYKYPLHKNILTTYFWIGEDASEENSWISNHHSAWDEDWVNHYGGIDDPDCRNGYHPCGFTPKENPFYCALPYSDFDDEGPKANLQSVPWYEDYLPIEDGESIIKNQWVKIIFNEKEAYCQLEDAGPGSSDDFDYVFGDAAPIHKNGIGLDVSPAVRDYLGLDGMDQTSWQHVDDEDVPNGVWTEIITTSGTCWGCEVEGCTDADSLNYNADATIDDGSCITVIEGCTDSNALNFNSNANVDDGSCELYESTLTEHQINVNFNNQVKAREYLVYEPVACKTKECPLLFMFHGLGGNAQNAASNNYGWQKTADDNGFIVAFPDSLFIEAKNYGPGSDPAGKHWDINALVFKETQDTKFVEEMILVIDEEYDVDKSKMFTTGHSYGGYFSYYLNFVLNNKFKVFGTHSAGLISYNFFGMTFYWPATPLVASNGNVPAMIIYSDGDNVAPSMYSNNLESQMKAKSHLPVIKQKSSIIGHGWDKSMNQEQWDFFMANS